MRKKDCDCDDDYFARHRRRKDTKSDSGNDPKDALYKATIMRHYRLSEYRREMPSATITSRQVNRSCGDQIRLYIDLTPDGLIQSASYQGEGCSICVASASMLCAGIKGKYLHEAIDLAKDVITMLADTDAQNAHAAFDLVMNRAGTGGVNDLELSGPMAEILSLWSVRQYGTRVPCALLAWNILPTLVQQPVTP